MIKMRARFYCTESHKFNADATDEILPGDDECLKLLDAMKS